MENIIGCSDTEMEIIFFDNKVNKFSVVAKNAITVKKYLSVQKKEK